MRFSLKKIFIVFVFCLLLVGCKKDNVEINKDNNKNDSELQLINNLNLEINSEVYLLSLVSISNKVEIISDNEVIDTSKIGKKELTIKYIINGKEKEHKFKVLVRDTTKPKIENVKDLSVKVGNSINLLDNIVASDNSREQINVTVNGTYDFNKEGTYKLKYVAIDSSNNKKEIGFTLTVSKTGNTNVPETDKNNPETDKNNPETDKNNPTTGKNDPETDKNNPETDKNNQTTTKKTYYRYRTKHYESYNCGTYDCSYIDYNDKKQANVNFASNSPCGGGKNPVINQPCPFGMYCATVMTPQYKVHGNICYDSTYIWIKPRRYSKTECDSNEIKISGYCHRIESKGEYIEGCTKGNCVKFSSSSPCGGGFNRYITYPCPIESDACIQVMTSQYKIKDNICYDSTYIVVEEGITEKKNCDSNEINLSGYCHRIESKGTYSCPSGYSKVDETTCARNISKTCSKTCKSETWSEWSNWTTAKVTPSDTVQVETKQM